MISSDKTMLVAKVTNIFATLSLFITGIAIGKGWFYLGIIFITGYIIFIWIAWDNIFASQKLFIKELK